MAFFGRDDRSLSACGSRIGTMRLPRTDPLARSGRWRRRRPCRGSPAVWCTGLPPLVSQSYPHRGLVDRRVIHYLADWCHVDRLFRPRCDARQSLQRIELLEGPLALTPRQARRISRQFARAGVNISPSRLRAISAGAEDAGRRAHRHEFGLIATEPDHDSLLHSNLNRRA